MQHGVPRVSGVAPTEQARKSQQKKIEAYKDLVAQVQSKIQAKDYSAETLSLTSALLSQNPEYYTIWNNRRLILQDVFAKELAGLSESKGNEENKVKEKVSDRPLTIAQQEILLLIQEDLAFLIPILKNYPKCYWIWNHRTWLLEQASEYLPAASAVRLWQGELGLVSKMLNYDSRNFHGWHYRRIVVKALEDLSKQEDTERKDQNTTDGREQEEMPNTAAPPSMTESEFAYTTKMIKTNLSNFSAWHNRLQLIPKLLDERRADSTSRRKLLDEEFELITTALYTDPYDQSLWFYYDYLMSTLVPNGRQSSDIVLDFTNHDRIEYLEQQIDMLKDMLEATDDCKWIYQALLTCTPQYLEIEAGNKKVSTMEMRSWLDQLEKLDPLRKGRWAALRNNLNL